MMPAFSQKSKDRLKTAHVDLQQVANEVIKVFDFTVLYGFRSKETQFELFKRGRAEIGGVWVVVNRLEVVTNCDGFSNTSRHNVEPADAIDITPWPIDWHDRERMYYLGGYVLGIAKKLGIEIRFGGDWDRDGDIRDQNFYDLVHYERIVKL
jgi:peptidoglycan L-alanyl-D-glutamate endopeptidase CwlK